MINFISLNFLIGKLGNNKITIFDMIKIVAAVSGNGVIGKSGKLVFNDKQDKKLFKDLTIGCNVLMGRKTFDSLDKGFKPLPNRTNVVLTTNLVEGYKLQKEYPSVVIKHNLNFLRDSAFRHTDFFIIGGGDIYQKTIDFAHELHISEFSDHVEGDVYFPEIDPLKWQLSTETNYDNFTYKIYKRK